MSFGPYWRLEVHCAYYIYGPKIHTRNIRKLFKKKEKNCIQCSIIFLICKTIGLQFGGLI